MLHQSEISHRIWSGVRVSDSLYRTICILLHRLPSLRYQQCGRRGCVCLFGHEWWQCTLPLNCLLFHQEWWPHTLDTMRLFRVLVQDETQCAYGVRETKIIILWATKTQVFELFTVRGNTKQHHLYMLKILLKCAPKPQLFFNILASWQTCGKREIFDNSDLQWINRIITRKRKKKSQSRKPNFFLNGTRCLD